MKKFMMLLAGTLVVWLAGCNLKDERRVHIIKGESNPAARFPQALRQIHRYQKRVLELLLEMEGMEGNDLREKDSQRIRKKIVSIENRSRKKALSWKKILEKEGKIIFPHILGTIAEDVEEVVNTNDPREAKIIVSDIIRTIDLLINAIYEQPNLCPIN